MRIMSYPRSGTHYLAAMVHTHLYNASPAQRRTVDSRRTGHVSRRAEATPFHYDGAIQSGELIEEPYGTLVGTHRLPNGRETDKVYIVRDGRDVALSLYRWTKYRSAGDQNLTFSAYMRKPRDWGHILGGGEHYMCAFWSYWVRHVDMWTQHTNAHVVHYEQLLQAPLETLRSIAEHFGMTRPVNAEPLGPTGWNPGSHFRVGRWTDELSAEDKALFDNTVPWGFAGRWDE